MLGPAGCDPYAIFNNILFINWWSVLAMQETQKKKTINLLQVMDPNLHIKS
jgi:hypothetical protein